MTTHSISIPEFLIEPTNFETEGSAIVALREQCEVLASDPWVDAQTWHCVARVSLERPQVIGCVRFSTLGEVSLLCVAPEFRRRSVATALLRWARDTARERGLSRIYCWPDRSKAEVLSDPALVAFLGKVEFSPDPAFPGRFLKSLPLREPVARIVDQQVLQSAARVSVPIGGKTREALSDATLQVIADVRRDLWIYTRDLDPAVLNTNALLEALRALSLRPGAHIRILVQDTSRAIKDGHRLIELSRRVPSTIEFRCPQSEDLQYIGAFVVNDNFGFVERSFGDRFECEGDLYHVAEQGRLRRYFAEVWERARLATELRRLSL